MKNIICILILLCSFAVSKNIHLTIGESKIIKVKQLDKIVVGNPNVVSVKIISEKEVLISGKSSGETTLILKSKTGKEKNIQINVLETSFDKPMVEINVQMYEIQKKKLGNFGINWEDTVKALSIGEQSIPPLFKVGTFDRLKKIEGTLNLLIEKGYAKLLAKPRLLVISGKKAAFLSGGEVPIIYQDVQRFSIDYKSYGVNLEIKPVVDEHKNISTSIRAEVSNIDIANGVLIGSTQIPALKTRWVKTSVSVKQNATIVIAGLIQNEKSKKTKGIPILSDIPLIGEIFKSTYTESLDTELVIFLTPSIIGSNVKRKE